MKATLAPARRQAPTIEMRTDGFACPECEGAGGQSVCPQGCSSPPYCGHIEQWKRCAECDGKAVRACEFCGEARAEVKVGREHYCMDCYEESVEA